MTTRASSVSGSESAAAPSLTGLADTLRQTFRRGVTHPIEWRTHQLRRLLALLEENENELLAALTQDLGKPRFEGWASELGILRSETQHTLKHLKGWLRPRRVNAPMTVQPSQARIHAEPLGVVLIIAPWNYPIQLALAPLIGALAGGNCVVVKPSEVAPASSAVMARLVPRYLDPDCVRIVEGGVTETTALLAQRWDHIFYTGNGTVGRIVLAAAAQHLTPVTLELGGKSPALIDSEVDLEVTARRIVWGKFFNAGQTCVAPDYVLVSAAQEQPLLARLRATLREFYGEDPQKSPDYGRIVNARHHSRLLALLGSGEIVTGGQSDAADRYLAPTVLRGVATDSPVMADEIFGPILPVITVPNLDAAITFVNAREKPLALYVFSKNGDNIEKVIAETSSGGVCVNDAVAHLIPPELPFGGVGGSGMGAYHGRFGFDTFTHQKGVLDRATFVDPALRYPPYSESKLKWVKRLS
jgi:aldehyde dehydrogenase (NAD+)